MFSKFLAFTALSSFATAEADVRDALLNKWPKAEDALHNKLPKTDSEIDPKDTLLNKWPKDGLTNSARADRVASLPTIGDLPFETFSGFLDTSDDSEEKNVYYMFQKSKRNPK